jgi:hypothetical protein
MAQVCMEQGLYIDHVPASLLAALERAIDSLSLAEALLWKDRLGRRRKTFEFGVSFQAIERDGMLVSTPVPAWLAHARTTLVTLFHAQLHEKNPDMYENCIITIYSPGDGIAPHTDRDYFGPDVLGIIVTPDQSTHPEQPPAALSFVKSASSEVVALPEDPGLAFLFQGVLRYAWLHELAPVHTGRIAVQFRTVVAEKVRQNPHWNYDAPSAKD